MQNGGASTIPNTDKTRCANAKKWKKKKIQTRWEGARYAKRLPDVKAERIQRWKGREKYLRAQIFIRLLRSLNRKKYEKKRKKKVGKKATTWKR